MKIGFASSMDGAPWGASEILWYETAKLLLDSGSSVSLVTCRWPSLPAPIHKAKDLWHVEHSFDLSGKESFARRMANRLPFLANDGFRIRWLRRTRPRIFCISNGSAFDGLAWMEAAVAESVPFVTIAHAHADFFAPDDANAERLIRAFAAARANYFVSRANQELVECQLGWRFPNARLIAAHSSDPVTSAPLPWPESADQSLRLACVGRLHTPSKGQDLLFNVLADPCWRDRNIQLSLYGTGDHEQCLRRLASLLGISDLVTFMGHTSTPMAIWATHHALILTSRYEGLPLVFREAMLAGRPVIATAVAGAPELIDHGRTGFLAEAATTQHMQRCMEEAWSLRESWPSIGLAAHAEAAERSHVPPATRLAAELLEFASP
jgi:glycosyltransferase involved in cell wall biosynthesis